MISNPPRLKYNYSSQVQNEPVATLDSQLIQSRQTIDQLKKEKEHLNKNLKDLILENFQLKNIIQQQKKQEYQQQAIAKQKEQEATVRKKTALAKEREDRTQIKVNTEGNDKSGDAYRIIKHSHMVDDLSQLQQQLKKPTLIEQLSQSQFKKTSLTPSRAAKNSAYDPIQQNNKTNPSQISQQKMITPPRVSPSTHKKLFQLSSQKSKAQAIKSRTAQRAIKNTNKPYLHTNEDYLSQQYCHQSTKCKPQQKVSISLNKVFRVNPQNMLKVRQQQNNIKKNNNPYVCYSPGQSKLREEELKQAPRSKPSYLDYIPADYQQKCSPNRLKPYQP